jgi:hypothetical protein
MSWARSTGWSSSSPAADSTGRSHPPSPTSWSVISSVSSTDDVKSIAEAIDPGSSAAVLVWENKWAAPFGAAVRHSGGQLVASGRIPIQALLAAIEADNDVEEGD